MAGRGWDWLPADWACLDRYRGGTAGGMRREMAEMVISSESCTSCLEFSRVLGRIWSLVPTEIMPRPAAPPYNHFLSSRETRPEKNSYIAPAFWPQLKQLHQTTTLWKRHWWHHSLEHCWSHNRVQLFDLLFKGGHLDFLILGFEH